MRFFQAISLCILSGLLASCDLKKPQNTAPKPPPAPAAKPKAVIKQKDTVQEKEQKIVEPAVLEWEGGDFSISESFRQADILLVMFYADWCPHCKSMGTLLEGMTMSKEKTIRVLKINADLFPEIAQKFRLDAVPKVLIFRKGEQVGEFVGAITEDKLNTIIRNVSGDKETLP